MPPYYLLENGVVKATESRDNKELFLKADDLSAINQFGDHVSLNRDLPGKELVVDFFFTSCPSTCPRLTRDMALLQRLFRPQPMSRNDTIAQFISITVDPARDSFQALRNYANQYQANSDHWWFLTGDKKTLYDYARNQLHVIASSGDGGDDDFIHTEKMVLLDRNRYIRGYYDGLDSNEIKRCADDMGRLFMEEHLK